MFETKAPFLKRIKAAIYIIFGWSKIPTYGEVTISVKAKFNDVKKIDLKEWNVYNTTIVFNILGEWYFSRTSILPMDARKKIHSSFSNAKFSNVKIHKDQEEVFKTNGII